MLIPRIPLISTDLPVRSSDCNLQAFIPVQLAFAITINKAQGQSLKVTGLDLTDECFSHCGNVKGEGSPTLFIIADNQQETKNIVYRKVLKYLFNIGMNKINYNE